MQTPAATTRRCVGHNGLGSPGCSATTTQLLLSPEWTALHDTRDTMRRNGTNGVVVNTLGRDPNTTMVPLPRAMTWAQATAATHQLGQPRLGVVLTKNGYGARCLLDNRAAV